ncbi:MAG: hypothetical protein SXQ77_13165 [Halobacteria archaeon]|nr:hypothetical protein [Halobacteria archaeon]
MNISRLMEFLHDELGKKLRGVAYTEGDGVEIEYIRRDIREEFSQEELDKLVEAYTEGEYSRKHLEKVHKIDEAEYLILKAVDSFTVVIFPNTDTTIYIAFDTDVDIMSSHFVNECLSHLGMGDGVLEKKAETGEHPG